MVSYTAKQPLYSNYLMISPLGEPMCRLNKKKAEWYIKRHLAEFIHNPEQYGEEKVLQLKFDPNGLGHNGDKYALDPREDMCVVCGSCAEISRHHVTPKCYVKFLETPDKEHKIRNVVPLCISCHILYEREAEQYKYELAGGQPAINAAKAQIRDKNRAITFASTILNVFDVLPIDTLEEMWDVCSQYLGVDDISIDELEKLASTEKETWTSILFENTIKNIKSLEEFSEMWRTHFIETMEPKFLPESYLDKHPMA